jgi:hypothetical protein
MVLTGLIIIAVVLTALMVPGVPGIQRKLPGANASRGPGPGSARIPRRDIMSTLTSRDAEATGNPDQALAVLDDHPATLSGPPTPTSSTPGTPADDTAMPGSTISASGATLRKPPDCRTRMRADRPDLHAQRVHSP